MRKDAYMAHVQSKHMADMGQFLLRDWAENNVTPISQFAQSKTGKIMVIHSRLYEEHEYWFGIKPTLWKNGANGYSEYIRVEDNIERHRNFIEQILKAVSLYDWISIKKEVIVRHPDILTMTRELTDLKKTSALEIERLNICLKTCEDELQRMKTTIDLPYGTLDEMNGKMQHMTCRLEKMKSDSIRDKRQIETLQNWNDSLTETSRKEYTAEIRYWQDKHEKMECAYKKLMEEVTEQKEEVQRRIAKHLEKEEAKKQKELERDRAREEAEFKRTEAKYKKLKRRGLKKSDSDSDSD